MVFLFQVSTECHVNEQINTPVCKSLSTFCTSKLDPSISFEIINKYSNQSKSLADVNCKCFKFNL